MSDQTDEQLMQAYREGNPRAFELLLARHERKVWNFLRRSVGDPTAAEDLLQEVFLRVIKAQADSDRRSFMNEVTVLLEEALAEREQQRTKVQRRAAN